jgi:hypothetical protein
MYFSHKLRAAVCYKKYQDTSDNNQLSQSVEWLEKATADWDILVEVTTPVYDPMPVSHVGYRRNDSLFHWSIIQEQVHAELAKLKNDSLE